jgi:UPF0176 protein
MPPFAVAAFYRFTPLPDFEALRAPLLGTCRQEGVLGTILLAPEGINGTIAGTPAGVDAVLGFLHADPRLRDLEPKTSYAEAPPFHRMKVRLKKEIVSLRVPGIDPCKQVGTYVDPADWNALVSDPDVLVIDTRNDFEVGMGTFEGAKNPQTASFSEFPDYARRLDPAENRRVAMFCTGGIRCEKATSFLLRQGFEEVYHLKGGILKYLEEVPPEESLWQGECFVFDGRVALGPDLTKGTYELCYACHAPVSAEDRASPHYREGVHCPRCHTTLTDEKRRSAEERQRQIELASRRGEQHLGESAAGC